jgi:hypothetical protein
MLADFGDLPVEMIPEVVAAVRAEFADDVFNLVVDHPAAEPEPGAGDNNEGGDDGAYGSPVDDTYYPHPVPPGAALLSERSTIQYRRLW